MSDGVRLIRSADLTPGPATPGMERFEAFADDSLWMGDVQAAPGSVSGWHHHGEHNTVGRVLSGTLRFEFGSGGNESVEVGPGDYFVVPPGVVHREGNPGADDGLVVLVRHGTGPTVVNVDGPA